MTVVRRWREAWVLLERFAIEWIHEKVQRSPLLIPTGARRIIEAVEDRKATATDSEQRPILQLAFVGPSERKADGADAIECSIVVERWRGR